ncbi:hypothetical protein GCM10009854_22760 [Saccharopolyspora halophila]|uniref:Uncharacterized protein n=1 Tax=Saccharopolyspora halophila TaxID=405551 RepID=A0ABP5T4N9_9PSEU
MIRLVPAALALFAVAGCAGEPVQPKVRQQLTARVAELKTAALSHDRAGAEAALSSLHREIANAVSAGTLDSEAAGQIMIAADRVAEDVRTIPGPGQARVTVTVDPGPNRKAKDHE